MKNVDRAQGENRAKYEAGVWEATFDSINDMVSIHDADFKLVKVNRKFAETFKKKPEEIVGKPCYQVLHKTDDSLAICPYRKMMETGEPVSVEYYEPGLGMTLEITASPILNEKKEIVSCVHIARNITERKRMEENMIITGRLASIGEMVAGIAHEINNPLTSVIGYLELIMERGVPEKVREDIAIVRHEAERAAGVVSGLLNLAKKRESVRNPTNINSVMATVLRLRSYEQKVRNINVKTSFDNDLPLIMADSFQMQQVFLNIIINAEYFMVETHGRGLLTVTTEMAEDAVRITFLDDGPGISEENMEHIFDPFFTTKEDGRGTGLGLSICRGIIDGHGGRIYAVNEVDEGARFIIELPVADGKEEVAKQ